MKFYSYNKILDWVNHDHVVPLCGNCHNKYSARIFLDFKNLILDSNLFSYSSEQIDTYINNSINRHKDYIFKKNKRWAKIQVKKFIKKRFVLEQLYNARCIGCGKITVYDNLLALEIHHRNNEIKTFMKWQEIASRL